MSRKKPPSAHVLDELYAIDAVNVSVIASGGVETLEHMVEGIRDGHATAVLAASISHFGLYSIAEAKAHMAAAGVPIRPIGDGTTATG